MLRQLKKAREERPGYSSPTGRSAIFSLYNRPQSLYHVDCPDCVNKRKNTIIGSETIITYFPECNTHRPMLIYSEPQSGKCIIDSKTGYWTVIPIDEREAPPYRLRIDNYGDVWCPNCGLIFGNSDKLGYFQAITPIKNSPYYYNNDDEFDYGEKHDDDTSVDNENIDKKARNIFIVPDLNLNGKLIQNPLIYVHPKNNQASILKYPDPDDPDREKNLEFSKWVEIPKDLHRELSELGYLPRYRGNKTKIRKTRTAKPEVFPTLDHALKVFRERKPATAATT